METSSEEAIPGNEQEIKILAWINAIAVEVMRSIQVLNILDFKANRAPHILNMEFIEEVVLGYFLRFWHKPLRG